MKKCYTIVAFFSVSDYNDMDECWIAHFSNRDDAIKCFEQKMKECGSTCDAKDTFNDILDGGHNFVAYDGTMFFVRNEEIQDTFDREKTSWS